MHIRQPARKELVYAWIAMMLLTIGTMVAGHVTSNQSPGILWMGSLMLITFFKARYILRYYLNLKAATGGWNSAFNIFLVILLLSIMSLFAIPAILDL